MGYFHGGFVFHGLVTEDISYWLLAVGCWLLAIGYWLLAKS
jgi:hypothetical protein